MSLCTAVRLMWVELGRQWSPVVQYNKISVIYPGVWFFFYCHVLTVREKQINPFFLSGTRDLTGNDGATEEKRRTLKRTWQKTWTIPQLVLAWRRAASPRMVCAEYRGKAWLYLCLCCKLPSVHEILFLCIKALIWIIIRLIKYTCSLNVLAF